MWQVLKTQDVMNYWKVAEFVSSVMDMVPELLMYKHRTQLNLGLRARVSTSGEDKKIIAIVIFCFVTQEYCGAMLVFFFWFFFYLNSISLSYAAMNILWKLTSSYLTWTRLNHSILPR